ncbi:MAG: hypothetical protein GC129_06335 [Proteobacteria bacterium]|nr:hypothetical protein [Pseudomonadota bacterium]
MKMFITAAGVWMVMAAAPAMALETVAQGVGGGDAGMVNAQLTNTQTVQQAQLTALSQMVVAQKQAISDLQDKVDALGGTTTASATTPSAALSIPKCAAGEGLTSTDGATLVCVKAPHFGAWETRAPNTVYRAATDGIAMAWCQGAVYAYLYGYTDASNPPTTMRGATFHYAASGGYGTMTMPVRAGDYWKISNVNTSVLTCTTSWMPLTTQ